MRATIRWCREVASDALFDLFRAPLYLGTGEVPVPVVHCLDLAAIDRDDRPREQVELAAQFQNWCRQRSLQAVRVAKYLGFDPRFVGNASFRRPHVDHDIRDNVQRRIRVFMETAFLHSQDPLLPLKLSTSQWRLAPSADAQKQIKFILGVAGSSWSPAAEQKGLSLAFGVTCQRKFAHLE